MSSKRRFAELFEEPPETWRTRGDPYLWAALRTRLGELQLPASAEELRSRFEQEFVALTGRPIEEPEPFFVQAFAHGGLSSGYITPQYWRTVIFPALITAHGAKAFTLKRTRWYACELIGEEFGPALRAYSPIRIRRCRPLKTGHGRLEVELRYANPPDGAADSKVLLQVLERTPSFLLARCVDSRPARLLLAHAIDWDWMRRHLGVADDGGAELQSWLDGRET